MLAFALQHQPLNPSFSSAGGSEEEPLREQCEQWNLTLLQVQSTLKTALQAAFFPHRTKDHSRVLAFAKLHSLTINQCWVNGNKWESLSAPLQEKATHLSLAERCSADKKNHFCRVKGGIENSCLPIFIGKDFNKADLYKEKKVGEKGHT